MVVNSTLGLGLRSFKTKTTLIATVAISLFGAIAFGGANLVGHLRSQDELLTSGLNRSERGLSQLDREILRLTVIVEGSDTKFNLEAAQDQIDLVESRLSVIEKHHISSDLSSDLAGQLVLLDEIWERLQADLTRWLANPQNSSIRDQVYGGLLEFEFLVNDLATQHSLQRRDQYVRLIGLRSKSIQLIAIISILFLVFICLAVVNTARFIQERQAILTAIREKEEQYRRIVETSEEGIWLLDPQGNTTFANHKMAEILGLDESTLQKTSLWSFLPSQADQEVAQAYLDKLRQGGKFPCDLKLARHDGQVLWMLTSGAAIFDDAGQHTGTLCMLTDVTARKHAEEYLKVAKQKAEVANHAKSEFLANMSHELRTPLNGILGYAQILSRSPLLSDKERDGVEVIRQCGSHLLTLINDILDLSKIEARKLELVPAALHLPSLLKNVVEICQIKATRKDIGFNYWPSSQLPEGVKTDEKRLRQVLLNLLGNAVKFTDEGSVTLQVEVLEQSEQQVTLQFRVIDTGVGIAEENLPRLFKSFEQVGDYHRQAEGTGLGLAISQRIVRMMGGVIRVNSTLGEGSEFSFTIDFPLVSMSVPSSEIVHSDRVIGYQPTGKASFSKPQRTILVIDDRWENRSVFLNLLEPLGFEIIEAENGQDGLAKLRSCCPDLTIVDLFMPIMDGFEFLKQVRKDPELSHHTIIVSSASVTQADRQMAIACGSDDFLAKPVDAQALLKLMPHYLSIEWLYETQTETLENGKLVDQTTLPSRQMLESLLDLSRRGHIKALREQLEKLGNTDVRYAPFADYFLRLAKNFRTDEIETLLQDCLSYETT